MAFTSTRTQMTLVYCRVVCWSVDSSPPGQNGCHFADNIFKCMFMNEKFYILIRISLKFVPKGADDNKSVSVQVMAWCRTGNKPLPEPMLTLFTGAYIRHHSHQGEMRCVEGHPYGWLTQPCSTSRAAGLCTARWCAAGLCPARLHLFIEGHLWKSAHELIHNVYFKITV